MKKPEILSHLTGLLARTGARSKPGVTLPLRFNPSKPLSLGVEIELQLINRQTLNLAPVGEAVLDACRHSDKVKPELFLSTIEINTDICYSVQEVGEDLQQTIAQLSAVAQQLDIALSTTGAHPFAKYSDCIISSCERYQGLLERNQWLTRRTPVYGLHIHLGMTSGEDCIRYNNFLLRFLPHLIALSASSPFWQGEDTGLAACRPTVFESLPTCGTPYLVRNWAEFEQLIATLTHARAITSLKDLWWDIRPSPSYGTLELRVCDGLATLQETLAIVSFVHGLCYWFRDHADWIDHVPLPNRWMLRENKWRAIRHGLEAEIVVSEDGTTRPLRQDMEEWLQKLAPYNHQLNYNSYNETLREILTRGNSADRQRQIYAASGNSLEAVVQHNIHEFETNTPLYSDSSPSAEPPLLKSA